jgi:hypothetical protein
VNVQLIDAETGAHLWAERFDTDRANLAEAQDAITGRLAGVFGGTEGSNPASSTGESANFRSLSRRCGSVRHLIETTARPFLSE